MNQGQTPKNKRDFRVLIVYPNLPGMMLVPIAIGLFTRILKDQGYQADLFDTSLYEETEETGNIARERAEKLQSRSFSFSDNLGVDAKPDMFSDFRRKVETFRPDLMIISAVENTFLRSVRLIGLVEDMKIPHLLGGVFPTSAPEICFDFPEVRMIAIGEGERTIVQVAEALRTGAPLHDIPGTWFKDDKGRVVQNPMQPLADINRVIPDFSLIEDVRFMRPLGGRFFRTITVESYRGCPYSCTYCNSPNQRAISKENDLGNFLRRKTLDVLRNELRANIEAIEPNCVFFIDDSFLARPRREIFDFCDMYEEFRLPFWFNTRPENCEPDTLARLKEVGCYRMTFGLECGNEEYRSRILQRRTSNAKYLERYEIIAASGIPFNLNVIIGMPGETRELVMDTVEMVRSIPGYDSLSVNAFTPYIGTHLRRVCEKNGWIDPKAIAKHFTSESIMKMAKPYLSGPEIDSLATVFPLYCYFPKSDWEKLRRAEENDRKGLAIRERYAAIYRDKFLGETQDSIKERFETADAPFRVSPKRLTEEQFVYLT